MSIDILIDDDPHPGLLLSLDKSKIYAVSFVGNGQIFSVPASTGSRTILHTFSNSEGNNPNGYLILSANGNTIYGTIFSGINSNVGNLYSMSTNGSNFTILHTFGQTIGDGYNPNGGLLLVGNTLYGTTVNGGAYNNGTVYSISTNGSSYTILHSFNQSLNEGSGSNGGLTIIGSVLYGTTISGGTSGTGVLFSLNTNGTNFTVLQDLTNSNTGTFNGQLISIGTAIYGTTTQGGVNNDGIIYSFETTGNIFSTIYDFTSNNMTPIGGLLYSQNGLFGVTQSGGVYNLGTIFFYSFNKQNFTTLGSFTSGAGSPNGSLINIGNVLYGTTASILFSFTSPIICFDESTKILCLVNNQETYIQISQLTSKHIVRIYQGDNQIKYQKIKAVGCSTMINNPSQWQNCMYRLPKNSFEGQTDDLIITGGHSILVDSLNSKQIRLQSQWWVNGFSKIEDKLRLLASLDERFVQIIEPKEFTYYHLVVEGPLERYGIYANGVLSESCTSKVFDEYHFDLIK